MKLHIKVPGSGGELIQGTRQGAPFLVTCPIDLFAEALVGRGLESRLDIKAQTALTRTLEYLHVASFPYEIRLHSDLPRGKGMASSSADIAAVCQAAALAVGKRLSAKEIAAIAAGIEPTDGIFCEGIVCMNHLSGEILQSWKFIPPVKIALLDIGGCVDTLRFNHREDLAALNFEKEPQIMQAMELLEDGMRRGDLKAIGRAASMSAFANQKILPKRHLHKIHQTAVAAGALGVNIAHSGTVVGLLFDANESGAAAAGIAAVRRACPEIEFLRTVRLISGGIEIIREETEDEHSI